jgi:CubicO group peptidase (beta-lactamase class C family)
MSAPIPIHGTCEPRFAAVREVFAKGFESGAEIGASVCFVRDGETLVDLWGGHVDRERSRPWQRDTLVNTYSTTKGMTALCAHMCVERGLLDLDAPVARYWPEFEAGGKSRLPVRWLLSHQAGLAAPRRRISVAELFAWQPFVAALAEQEPWWEPGTRHGYHALTFGHLVGELVRRVTGRSLGTFFREEVAAPLGADYHIGFGAELDVRTSDLYGELLPPQLEGSAPTLEGPLGDFFRDMRNPDTLTGSAFGNPNLGGGLVNTRAWRAAELPAVNGHGTARSLARIYGVLARGGAQDGVHLLERASIERAIEEQASGPDLVLGGMPMRFGLGFMLRQDFMPLSPSPRAFGHPGAGGSIGMADPDAKVGFGYTMNKMQMGMVGSAGAFAMIQAFFDAL